MTKQTIKQMLDEIADRIKKDKTYWRFNYSVGLRNGSCYGLSYEDTTLLKKKEKNKDDTKR